MSAPAVATRHRATPPLGAGGGDPRDGALGRGGPDERERARREGASGEGLGAAHGVADGDLGDAGGDAHAEGHGVEARRVEVGGAGGDGHDLGGALRRRREAQLHAGLGAGAVSEAPAGVPRVEREHAGLVDEADERDRLRRAEAHHERAPGHADLEHRAPADDELGHRDLPAAAGQLAQVVLLRRAATGLGGPHRRGDGERRVGLERDPAAAHGLVERAHDDGDAVGALVLLDGAGRVRVRGEEDEGEHGSPERGPSLSRVGRGSGARGGPLTNRADRGVTDVVRRVADVRQAIAKQAAFAHGPVLAPGACANSLEAP